MNLDKVITEAHISWSISGGHCGVCLRTLELWVILKENLMNAYYSFGQGKHALQNKSIQEQQEEDREQI